MTGRAEVDGLVLAGGRGSRMGGVDKGLQPLLGRALVEHVIARLAPQVGRIVISANRHLDEYARFGLPVVSDAAGADAFAGPLAGMAAGLAQGGSDWLIAVPCDCPRLPLDLVERLLQAALAQGAEAAVPLSPAADGSLRIEPAFCLMRHAVGPALQRYLARGGRKIQDWLAELHTARVPFTQAGDAQAFMNANTLHELQQIAALEPRP